jgi:hypothetical protein
MIYSCKFVISPSKREVEGRVVIIPEVYGRIIPLTWPLGERLVAASKFP